MSVARDLVVCVTALTTLVAVSVSALGRGGAAGGQAARTRGSVLGVELDLDRLPPTAAGASRDVGGARTARPPQAARAGQDDLDSEQAWNVGRQVDDLLGSGHPAHALLAYRLLASCASAQETARAGAGGFQMRTEPHQPVGACEKLDQAQVERRVVVLQLAVDAGAAGAAAQLLAQGPQGQPIATVWSDPRYAGWRAQSVELVVHAAEGGDIEALATLSRLYAHGDLPGDDGSAAIRYGTAWADAVAATNASFARDLDARAQFLAGAQQSIARYGAFLSPAQTAAAIAAGHAMVAAHSGA